jgi:hypothetical protein|tara:strand:- start:176 stop:400 length:225 start_codon:yes stop_codon:yes gene_type:complete
MVNLKKITVGKTTSTIKVEHPNTEYNVARVNKLHAIAILLGGYNELGRKMDVERYLELKQKFDNLVREVVKEIK